MERETITKPNSFILGRYDLTPNELKILSLGISQINKTDTKFIYKIKLNEVDAKFLERKNIQRLKALTKSLNSKVIELPSKEDEYYHISLVSSCKYIPKEQIIYIEFHKDLMPFILNLKDSYTTYQIVNILNLKSIYAIRFYELLRKDYNIQKDSIHKTARKNYELNYLFDIFQIPKSLQAISKLKEKILEVAQREINSKTDLHFDYELDEKSKIGKKFTKVKFTIRENHDINQDSKSTSYYKKRIQEVESYSNSQRMEHGEVIEGIYENCLNNTFINQHFLLQNNLYRLTNIKKVANSKFYLDLILKDTKQKRTQEINFNHANYENLYYFLNPLHTNI